MNNYFFKIKKRQKYTNLEKKRFFFNNVYNTKISKNSIIYKNWINKIVAYYVKNGNKKYISKKIKKELLSIFNEMKMQPKIVWVIALNESHQRSDFIVNAFKKKFSYLIGLSHKKKIDFSMKNQIKKSKNEKKKNTIFDYDIITLNNIANKNKNYNFSKVISFFISNKTFFWFTNMFYFFKKKKNFINQNWKFNKKIFFSKKYFFTYYVYFLKKKNWIYFYKNPNKKKKIYWNFWVNTNCNFFKQKKINFFKKNVNFKNKMFINFNKFNKKNKKFKTYNFFKKKKFFFFFKKKNNNFKWFKKSFFLQVYSKYIFFSNITKNNVIKFYWYKKYFSMYYNSFNKKNKTKSIFILWWWFFWSINKKYITNIKKKNKFKKKNFKKWILYKKKITTFNFIFEKNSHFFYWKKYNEKKKILFKNNLIYYNFIPNKTKYYFSTSNKKNTIEYIIKDINLFEEGKYLLIERDYSKTNFNFMYYDIIDLIAPFFKIIEQQKKTKKYRFIKYQKKKIINFNERQKIIFSWIKEFTIKNNKYNNLVRNPDKPQQKKKKIKVEKSKRVILPFSSRFFTEFNKLFYFEGELFTKLNLMDEKPFSIKIKKHFRWNLKYYEVFCTYK